MLTMHVAQGQAGSNVEGAVQGVDVGAIFDHVGLTHRRGGGRRRRPCCPCWCHRGSCCRSAIIGKVDLSLPIQTLFPAAAAAAAGLQLPEIWRGFLSVHLCQERHRVGRDPPRRGNLLGRTVWRGKRSGVDFYLPLLRTILFFLFTHFMRINNVALFDRNRKTNTGFDSVDCFTSYSLFFLIPGSGFGTWNGRTFVPLNKNDRSSTVVFCRLERSKHTKKSGKFKSIFFLSQMRWRSGATASIPQGLPGSMPCRILRMLRRSLHQGHSSLRRDSQLPLRGGRAVLCRPWTGLSRSLR